MELSTYFRINAAKTGQFERTLIVAEEGAHVSYLEGCTAPMRDENQLHAAVVELIALDKAEIKYSTVQNWYPGDKDGKGRHLQLCDQARPVQRGQLQNIMDTGRDRFGDHLEIPELHPAGRQFRWRVLLGGVTNNHQQADTGTKMIHIGKEHEQHDRLQGHFRRPRATTVTAGRSRSRQGRKCAEFFAVRFAAAGQQMRRAHLPVYRG